MVRILHFQATVSFYGSGFVFTKNGYAIRAEHVISAINRNGDAANLYAFSPVVGNSKKFRVKVIYYLSAGLYCFSWEQWGGPLFLPETGDVIGVQNSTFIKVTKENKQISTGISYAIPINYIKDLIDVIKRNY